MFKIKFYLKGSVVPAIRGTKNPNFPSISTRSSACWSR